jgi:hypothetical protein
VCTVRATLVPSTRTCNTVRCSLSVATMTTESSGITDGFSIQRESHPGSDAGIASIYFP